MTGCAGWPKNELKPAPEIATITRVEKRVIPEDLTYCPEATAPAEKDAPLESDLGNHAIDLRKALDSCKDTLSRLVKWLND